ncbi:MAG: plastocyanin/azurin family copper-binding protein [Crenarchaeota archaeon]|nr:plastocyanin/azurin family copper-binding protein [Thermoproteota archaeon]
MVSIDKAAIVFSIAIALVGVAVAAVGSSADNSPAAPSQQMSSMNTDAAEKAAAEKAAAEKAAAEKAAAERAAAERAAADAAAADAAAADAAAADSVATAGPQLHIVETAMGSGAPGCETSNACYLPADITISIGDTVQWNNVDKAAHTVSGGNPADGPSGVFDSSLLMAGLEYSFTFNDAGNYDYFCMVHPWMTGSVTVN